MPDLTYPVLDNATFKRLIDMGDGTHAEVVVADPPAALQTDNGGDHARIRVDVGQTGFWNGNQFRISYELTVTATPIVVKLVSPIDFILENQHFTCDHGGYVFRAYRASQGSPSGSFTTLIDIWQNNFMAQAPVYAGQVTAFTGGAFTPTVGVNAVETIRMMANTGGAAPTSGSPNTVGADGVGERGLPAGTYYLVFSRMSDVTVNAQGVWSLIYEERP